MSTNAKSPKFEDFLRDCIKRQMEAGKPVEIRLVPQITRCGGVVVTTFYAHPMGVDGQTVDYVVMGDSISHNPFTLATKKHEEWGKKNESA